MESADTKRRLGKLSVEVALFMGKKVKATRKLYLFHCDDCHIKQSLDLATAKRFFTFHEAKGCGNYGYTSL